MTPRGLNTKWQEQSKINSKRFRRKKIQEKEDLGEKHPCTFCKKICKSTAGLMSHMNRIHPLDSPSGLTCYTCNKLFTNRDLIENHYKTVKHKLECKKLRRMEGVERTTPEEDIRQYWKNLLEITQFKAPEYKPRTWQNEETSSIKVSWSHRLQNIFYK